MTRKRLGEVLLEAGLIDAGQLEAALHQQASWGGRIGKILLDSGFVGEEQLVDGLAVHLGCPRVSLKAFQIPPALVSMIPVASAEKFHAVPLELSVQGGAETLVVATSDPTNLEALQQLARDAGKRIVAVLASESEVGAVIRRSLYGEGQSSKPSLLTPLPPPPSAPTGDWFLPSDTGTFLLTEEAPPAAAPAPLLPGAGAPAHGPEENTGPFGATNAYIGGDDEIPRGYSGSWWPKPSGGLPESGARPVPDAGQRVEAIAVAATEGPFGRDTPLPVGHTGSWWLQASADPAAAATPPWSTPVEAPGETEVPAASVVPGALADVPRGFSGSWWPTANGAAGGRAEVATPLDEDTTPQGTGLDGVDNEAPEAPSSLESAANPGDATPWLVPVAEAEAAAEVTATSSEATSTAIPDDWGALVDNPPAPAQRQALPLRPLPSPTTPPVESADEITAREVAVLRLPPDRSPMGFPTQPSVARTDTWEGDSFYGASDVSRGLSDPPQPSPSTSDLPPRNASPAEAPSPGTLGDPRLPKSVLVADLGASAGTNAFDSVSEGIATVPVADTPAPSLTERSDTLDVVVEAGALLEAAREHTDTLDVVVDLAPARDGQRERIGGVDVVVDVDASAPPDLGGEHSDTLNIVVDVAAAADGVRENTDALDVVVDVAANHDGQREHTDALDVVVDVALALDGAHEHTDGLEVVVDVEHVPQAGTEFESPGHDAEAQAPTALPSSRLTSLDIYLLERPTVMRRPTTMGAPEERPSLSPQASSSAGSLQPPPGTGASDARLVDSVPSLRGSATAAFALPRLVAASLVLSSSVFTDVDNPRALAHRPSPGPDGPRVPPTAEPAVGDALPNEESTGFAAAWESAAERPLLTKELPSELEIPARRRALEAPVSPEVAAKPTPQRAYVAAGPKSAGDDLAPWGFLGQRR